MARKRIKRKPGKIVQFNFEDCTYQIDPDLRKVYRSFVEIETATSLVSRSFDLGQSGSQDMAVSVDAVGRARCRQRR